VRLDACSRRQGDAAQDLAVARGLKSEKALCGWKRSGAQVIRDGFQFVWIGALVAVPLTVEVMAQTVTVPSLFTRPLMLRSPSVAGAHEVQSRDYCQSNS
jgi:hypothetical protein